MATKTVYSFCRYTGRFTGEYEAQESPLEPGIFLIPAFATEEAPPAVGANEVAAFDGEQWQVYSDYRGGVYYDTETKERHEITAVGDVPLENWTDVAPTDSEEVWNGTAWVLPFDVLAERKKGEIAAARYASATGTLEIGGNTYNIDKDSQTSFLGTLAAFHAGAITSTIWTSDDFVTLSAEEFKFVVSVVLGYIGACFAAESSIQEQIEAAGSNEELSAVVWVAPDVSVVIAGLEARKNG